MMKWRQTVLVLAMWVTSSLPAWAAPVVADIEVVQTSTDGWVVRIRASEAQAFDVIDAGAPFVVRLHQASISAGLAAIAPGPFGSVHLAAVDGSVEVRVSLAGGLRAEATQGTSPHIVDIVIAPH